MLGGDVTLVETEEGKGSLFRAEFLVSAAPAQSKEEMAQGLKNKEERDLNGTRILVVDDTEEIRTLTSEILKYFKAQVITAENGADALKVYEENRQVLDLILMDIRMPIMDGWEARAHLHERGCDIPIVALTANAMTDEVQEILAAGFDGYLSKPISPKELVSCLSNLIAARNTSEPSLVSISKESEQDCRSHLRLASDGQGKVSSKNLDSHSI
jgi:two-component system CheB/CheR fusion protein